MSGDIGIGATRAAVKLSQKVLAAGLPGYVQLAGGTNNHTVAKLKAVGLLNNRGERESERVGDQETLAPSAPQPLSPSPSHIAGVAYGSYARVLLAAILEELESNNNEAVEANEISRQRPFMGHLEELPPLLWQAVEKAHSLVAQIKSARKTAAYNTQLSRKV
jgi:hypothetical protein